MKRSSSAQSSIKSNTHFAEIKGLLLLACVVTLFLSLWSFSSGHHTNNWLGLLGYTVGWIFHSIFGLSSFLIAFYLAWIGICMMFHKNEWNNSLNHISFAVFIFSLCILLSLLEDRYPSFTNPLEKFFYASFTQQKLHFHLGGAPFYYIYQDLPILNLKRTLNVIGVAILFSTLLFASFIFLFRISLSLTLSKLWQLFLDLKRKNELEPILVTSESTVKEGEDHLRYVKLRIPESQSTNITQTGELLGIQPDKELKTRPSLSSKGQNEKEKQPKPDPKAKREAALTAQRVYNGDYKDYKLPPLTLLTSPKKLDQSTLKKDLKRQAEVLEETLSSFGIEAKVGEINCGPTITSFEVHPSIGVKVQKIKTLENDIALNMEAKSIRIIAPIPGKAAVGIEVPNSTPQEVSFKEMMSAYQMGSHKYKIPVLLGKTVNGEYMMSDLAKMPHCIIAGATGSGKSVCINTIVMSILYNARPDEIQLLMVDPKKVELTSYSELPHMIAPVITEPQGAYTALKWLVSEMEKRYELLKQLGVRNIDAFNTRSRNIDAEKALKIDVPEKLSYIVGIIDELADLMMSSNNDIETPIARIAQMARAVGIHLILATQRPSREVITGLIKANFPARISFKVASRINSQIVLDETGAESLLGNGDMLFLPPGTSHLTRAQGAFIRDDDIHAVIQFIKNQAPPSYRIESFDTYISVDESVEQGGKSTSTSGDTLYDQALDIVTSTGNASTTFLQRKLKIGYARAASLMDELEASGIVTPADGAKARRVIHARGKEDVDNAGVVDME